MTKANAAGPLSQTPVTPGGPAPFQAAVYEIADELRAIANLGLRFAQVSYDRERYEKTLALSARLVATLEARLPADVMEEYDGNLGHVSPALGADAAVFRDDAMLLIKREDNGLWAMPGGLVDVGETWAEASVRELHEEAGVEGKAVRLLGLFDSRVWGSLSKFHLYHAVFQVEIGDAVPVAGPETTDVGLFVEDDLPDLSSGQRLRVPLVFKQRRGEALVPYFDASDGMQPGSAT